MCVCAYAECVGVWTQHDWQLHMFKSKQILLHMDFNHRCAVEREAEVSSMKSCFGFSYCNLSYTFNLFIYTLKSFLFFKLFTFLMSKSLKNIVFLTVSLTKYQFFLALMWFIDFVLKGWQAIISLGAQSVLQFVAIATSLKCVGLFGKNTDVKFSSYPKESNVVHIYFF